MGFARLRRREPVASAEAAALGQVALFLGRACASQRRVAMGKAPEALDHLAVRAGGAEEVLHGRPPGGIASARQLLEGAHAAGLGLGILGVAMAASGGGRQIPLLYALAGAILWLRPPAIGISERES